MPPAPLKFVNVRPQHDAIALAELARSMRERGQESLSVRKSKLKGVRSLAFLEEFRLRNLHVEQVKAGLASVAKVEGLEDLRLLRMRSADLRFLAEIPRLQRLVLSQVQVKAWPSEPLSGLRHLTLWNCGDLGELEFLARLPDLQSLTVEGAAEATALPSLAGSPKLHTVWLTDLPHLGTLEGVAAAPGLRHLVVQGVPALPVQALAITLDHPTLEWVYPALESDRDSPRNRGAAELLAPRYGADLFERGGPDLIQD